MTTLTLDKIWVNLVATGDSVSGYSAFGRSIVKEAAGEVRTYGGGRQRSISQVGVRGTYTFTLRFLTQAQVDTLESWMSQLVQVRDNLGRKYFGVYYSLPATEVIRGQIQFDVTLELNLVTWTEAA